MGRILDWLEPQVRADIGDPRETALYSGIESVQPNPFPPRTEITVLLSKVAASGRMQLGVFDLLGLQGRRPHGWAIVCLGPLLVVGGKANAGSVSRSGVYLIKLATSVGTETQKAVLLN